MSAHDMSQTTDKGKGRTASKHSALSHRSSPWAWKTLTACPEEDNKKTTAAWVNESGEQTLEALLKSKHEARHLSAGHEHDGDLACCDHRKARIAPEESTHCDASEHRDQNESKPNHTRSYAVKETRDFTML